MKIEEFLNEGSCINKKLNFDGFIFSKNTKTIITDNIMSEDVFIDISSSEIWSHLNKYIAPFGGGKWDFVDKCHIELLLSAHSTPKCTTRFIKLLFVIHRILQQAV